MLRLDEFDSPLGRLTLVATDAALCALDFSECQARLLAPLLAQFPDTPVVRAADPDGYASRVRAYFAGDFRAIDNIRVDPGGTPFQRTVWDAVRRIPPGTVSTYGALARQLGRPGSARAVGAANARNPICLVIPCHRLVGADGKLRGYSGGLQRKRWFLQHEGAPVPEGRIVG